MKNLLLGCAIAIVPIMHTLSAQAADLQPAISPSVAYVPIMYNWTGFYIGANIGAGWSGANITDRPDGFSFNPGNQTAFIRGIQIDYNHQVKPPVALGVEWFPDAVEGDQNNDSTAVIPTFGDLFEAFAEEDWLTTLTARIGFAVPGWDHQLVYVKGGVGWGETQAVVMDLGTGASFKSTDIDTGWVTGIGLEWAFAPHLTARIDYLGSSDFSAPDEVQPRHPTPTSSPPTPHGIVSDAFNVNNTNVQMLAVNDSYMFSWPRTPGVARY